MIDTAATGGHGCARSLEWGMRDSPITVDWLRCIRESGEGEDKMSGLNYRRLLTAIVACAGTICIAIYAQQPAGAPGRGAAQPGGGAPGRAAATPPVAPISEEYLLLGDATRGAGEPMVAVDPTDPRHIIAVAMGNLQMLPGYKAPVTAGMTNTYHDVARSTITWLAVTHDGGTNWKISELPILDGKLTRCPDSIAGVTKTGIFLAGCEPRESTGDGGEVGYLGEAATLMSTDHGDTWSKRAAMVNSYNAPPFAPGLEAPHRGQFAVGPSLPVLR